MVSKDKSELTNGEQGLVSQNWPLVSKDMSELTTEELFSKNDQNNSWFR